LATAIHSTTGTYAGEALAKLKLGSPHMIALENNQIPVAFWCCAEGIFHIRWVRVQVD
jgi:hypothetical protein